MSRQEIRRIIGFILALLLFGASLTPPVNRFLCLPSTARLVVGEQMTVSLPLPDAIKNRLRFSVGDTLQSTQPAVVVESEGEGYHLKS